MRFVQPVVMVLGLGAYIAIFASLYELNESYEGPQSARLLWIPFAIGGVWILLSLVATVIAIVDSILKVRARKTRKLATDAMVVKLASIPFLLLSYLLVAVFFFGGFAAFVVGGPVLWVVGAIIGGLSYLVLLSTSVYAWAAIAQLRRDRIIGTGLTVLYAILSVVPVTDVAAGVLLFGHYRLRPRRTLVVVLLSAGLIVMGFGFLGFTTFGFPYDGNLIAIGPILVLSVGLGMIVATIIVSVVRRSTLRLEAQQSALAVVETSPKSDTFDRALAG